MSVGVLIRKSSRRNCTQVCVCVCFDCKATLKIMTF